MTRRKRVLMGSYHESNDTTSLLRAWGPFTLMKDEVEIVRMPMTGKGDWFKDWHYWFEVDVCFMHRPSTIGHRMIIEYAKLHGVPVWVDHDDDLLAIGSDNPVFSFYSSKEVRENVLHSYAEADVISCSSEVMWEDLKTKYNRKDAWLITTGLDDRFLGLKKNFTASNKIGWRGSKSHLIDLLAFQGEIDRVMREYPKLEWYFWGINPYFLNWRGDRNVKWVDSLNLMEYLNAITFQNCPVHCVPLVDTKFNRVKSNLAWLDATLSGSVVLGPDFEEWKRPGIISYKQNNFATGLEGLLTLDAHEMEEQHNLSWEYIRDTLLTSKLNRARSEILRNL